jgi:hypothetical protein
LRTKAPDLLGEEVRVGDYVIRAGHNHNLELSRVLEIHPKTIQAEGRLITGGQFVRMTKPQAALYIKSEIKRLSEYQKEKVTPIYFENTLTRLHEDLKELESD